MLQLEDRLSLFCPCSIINASPTLVHVAPLCLLHFINFFCSSHLLLWCSGRVFVHLWDSHSYKQCFNWRINSYFFASTALSMPHQHQSTWLLFVCFTLSIFFFGLHISCFGVLNVFLFTCGTPNSYEQCFSWRINFYFFAPAAASMPHQHQSLWLLYVCFMLFWSSHQLLWCCACFVYLSFDSYLKRRHSHQVLQCSPCAPVCLQDPFFKMT